MSEHDFRDEVPVWVKYLIFINAKSNKYYEVRIDLGPDGLYYLTKRWGRRPDLGVGQTKVESSQNLNYVINKAEEMVRQKVAKHYALTERPTGANSRVSRDVWGKG
ncbi:MAG TPA: WGR domain-containing protein [Actinomycetes bacterium]|nr:WGR domain-containing protein [Actinomycetes bacterium]